MATTGSEPFRASRYTSGAVVLHWVIALLILAQLAGGYAMTSVLREGTATQFDVYQLHKSLGVTVLVLSIARILWRLFNPAPPEPPSVGRLEAFAAGAVQFAFYALLILVPLAGWLMISVSRVEVETVLFFADWLPFPDLPGLGELDTATRATIEDLSAEAHELLAYSMIGLLALHVAGALKHQFADGVFLTRMWFRAPGDGPRKSRGAALTALVVLLFAGGLVGAATYARNQPPVVAPPAEAPADEAAGTPAAPAAEPAEGLPSWTLDKAASTLTYTVAYSGSDVSGAFATFDATILFSPQDLPNSAIDVTIDTTSASIQSSEISRQNLAGPDGFANSEFGTARFRSDAIRAEGDGYVADGTLTIRGETLPQSLRFTVEITGDRATANGTMTVERLAYGIGRNSDASGKWLGLSVTVDVALTATRGAAAAPQAVAAEAPLWQAEPGTGRIGYAFRFDNDEVRGTLGAVDAEIRFAEENLGGSSISARVSLGEATVESGGVNANQLKGPQGLVVSEHPDATFVSDRIEVAPEGGFVAHGTLSVRGVSEAVRLPFTLDRRDDGLVDARGTLSLDRRAFGFAEELGSGGPSVGASVDVDIVLTARPPAAP